MFNVSIAVIDSSFLSSQPNREKTLAHVSRWVRYHRCLITIVTTELGVKFYRVKLESDVLESVSFVQLSNVYSSDHLGPVRIIIDFLCRIISSWFIRRPQGVDIIYTVTAVVVDPIVGLIIRWRLKSAPIFITFDNHVPKPGERPSKYINSLIAYSSYLVTLRLLKRADGIFAYLTDKNIFRLRLALANCQKDSVYQFSNGLDLDFIRNCRPSSEFRYDLIFIGRLHIAKGVFDFLETVKRLRASGHLIRAALVGPVDPEMRDSVTDYITSNAISDSVDLLGYVPIRVKYELLKASEVLLFLSYDDSFPIAVLEAIACGLSVVTYDLPVFYSAPYTQADLISFPKGNVSEVVTYLAEFFCSGVNSRQRISAKRGNAPCLVSYCDNADKEFEAFVRRSDFI